MLAKLPVERQALLDAADYIEEHGWCQYEPANRKGAVCAVGALMAVSSSPSIKLDAIELVKLVIGQWHIPNWNDAPERTKEEVVSALRAAALHGL